MQENDDLNAEGVTDDVGGVGNCECGNAAEENDGERSKDFIFAEKLIEQGELDEAQNALNEIKEHNAEWHFLQSRLFIEKKWFNEARKQLEIALSKEPENAKYIAAMEELNADVGGEMQEVATHKEKDKEGCWETCFLCSCECCGEGLCSLICNMFN